MLPEIGSQQGRGERSHPDREQQQVPDLTYRHAEDKGPHKSDDKDISLTKSYYGFGTYKPAARVISGIVQLQGALSTGLSNTKPIQFTLPQGMRPSALVYVEVDLCNANNGRLYIQPNGQVFVYAEGGKTQNDRCFTSLDGAWFAR
ncbi:MAG TPA: hypothetical protein VF834_19560 [Streptosporangiaceae bacterium]